MSDAATAQSDCQRCSRTVEDIRHCRNYQYVSIRFWCLDITSGTILALLIVALHDLLILNSVPLPWSLLASMSILMVLQFMFSLLIGSITGSLEAMIPGTFVAMGAMIVALMPMGQVSRLVAGATVGLLTSLGFVLMDAILRRRPNGVASKLQTRSVSKPPSFTIPTPAWVYDLLEEAGAHRRACPQRRLFAQMGERVLFVAAGSGLNFANFPPHRSIVAVDVNPEMLQRAHARAKTYDGILVLMNADVQKLPFEDAAFDTIATASTFCSVPDPGQGLSELYRVLKPGGNLLMFEHVRSRNAAVALNQDMMNFFMRFLGPSINRDTATTVRNAGFVIDRIGSAYLDVFLAIEGHKPARALR